MMSDGHLPLWLIVLLSPLVAVVAGAYGAVGLGGGSGYVAIMVLVGVPARFVPATALLLNLVVTGGALLRFGWAGRLRAKLLLPFLLPAIPAAVAGGHCQAPPRTLLLILALSLLAAAAATFHSAGRPDEGQRSPGWPVRLLLGVPLGVLIGFISGFVGLGGGVFLGPALLLLRWAGAKEVAAMNAIVVLCLSAAGLVGHGMRGSLSVELFLPFALAALAGGIAGAHLAERKLSPRALRFVLAALVLIAALKAAVDAVR
jgi:uncharacterized protein